MSLNDWLSSFMNTYAHTQTRLALKIGHLVPGPASLRVAARCRQHERRINVRLDRIIPHVQF